jgi:hypothetical protein
VELAAQTGKDLVSELWLGATVADRRKCFAFLREFLNRLPDLAEFWMRFDGHASRTISTGSRQGLQQVYHLPGTNCDR